jgi:hypothetical protein
VSDGEATGGSKQEPMSSESDLGSFVSEPVDPLEPSVRTSPEERFEQPDPVPIPEPQQHRVFAGTGISWAFIFGVLLTVAVIVLAVQNTDPAILIDEMIGMIIRRRKRKILADREELKHLRAKADSANAPTE